ncbi:MULTISPECIES: hypothetical protein [Bacillus]|uniref:hypothetical protein n=1 Tax=Bacillus TaxID=1386 RepID=UPI00119CFF1C|nr:MULTISPECIES: hypothetical protein [Bacillus]MDX9635981.1 hypothetical protein [Bacillus sp. PBL-C9]
MTSIIDIIVNANDRASGVLDRLADKANNTGAKIGMIGAVGSASMPALLAGLGGAVALMGTAGVAVAGFGALASGSIKGVIETTDELAKAQEKVDNASNAKERAKALAEQQAILAGLTVEQRNAVAATQDFKTAWSGMQQQLEPTTFTMMANGMNLTNNVMTRMFPAIQGVGNSFAGMIGQMNQAITSGKADAFFEHINTFAVPMFEMAMKSAGNILKGLGNIMMAFTPLGMQMGNGLVDLTAKFASWSAGLQSSQGFQKFVQFVQTSVPIIMNIFTKLFSILVKVGTALAPIGLVVLQLASDFLTWANSSTSVQNALNLVAQAGTWMSQNLDTVKTVLIAITAGFVAFKTALAISSTITTVATALGTMKTAFTTLRNSTMLAKTAQVLFNTAMWASPVTWVIAGIVALIAIGVLLWQNWDTVKAKAMELWGKMQEMWTNIKQSWNEGVNAVKQYFSNLWSDAQAKANQIKTAVVNHFKNMWNDSKNAWNSGVNAVKNFFTNLWNDAVRIGGQIKDGVVNHFKNLWNDAKNAWNTGVNAVKNFFQNLVSSATSIANNIKSGIINAFNSLWSSAKSLWSSAINGLKSIISGSVGAFISAVSNIANGIINGFRNGFNTVKSVVSNGIRSAVSVITGFVGTFLNAGKGLLSAFVDGIKSGISKAVGAVSEGMSKIRSYLPFSPAKKGALSDLDKSGKSFFPTWYEGALTQVRPMQRAISGAMSAVASEMDNSIGGETLRAFSGGRNSITIKHEHTVKGDVGIDGSGMDELARTIKSEVVNVSTGSNAPEYMKDLRQIMRKR